MFDFKHYVPILKWKRAEQGALLVLDIKTKESVTPLIQLVMPRQKVQEQLEDVEARFEGLILEIPSKIKEVWGGSSIFIDVSLLYSTKLKAMSIEYMINESCKLGARFIPVVYLNDETEIKKAVFKVAKKYNSGLCLRLICADFPDIKKLNENIKDFLSFGGFDESRVDLLIDIKETDCDNAKCQTFLEYGQQINNLSKWRTYIFASGAYPENLSCCSHDEENKLPRIGWLNWKKFVAKKNQQRNPSFADYSIQYPVYVESTQFFIPTTSIKYALENEWLIIKGKKKEYSYYLAGASLLAVDERFYGEKFSAGDKYIAEKAEHFKEYMREIKNGKDIKGTGSTETWLRAGINHHITLTAHQIANLS